MLYTFQFILISISYFCVMSSFGAYFLFPLFIGSKGGSKADIGIIMGTTALASVLCRPLIAELVDRRGRIKIYAAGSFAMGILPFFYLLLLGKIEDFYFPLILLRILHGIALAACFTASFTYIADISPLKRRNEGIGIFGVSGLSAMAFGPFSAEIIINRSGYLMFFVFAGSMALLGFLACLPLTESYRGKAKSPGTSFFSVLRSRKGFIVSSLTFFFGISLAASGIFISPFAESKGLKFISLYYLAYSGFAVIARLWGGKLADQKGEERIIPSALAIMGVGLVSTSFLQGQISLFVVGSVTGFGHGLLFPTLNALAVRGEPVGKRGTITGVFTGSIDAGSFLGGIILGYLGEWFGFPILFFSAGLSLFMALILFLKQGKDFILPDSFSENF